MTLQQVLVRAKTPPKVGDHEIVVGPDGLGHILIVTHVQGTTLSLMCRCPAIQGVGVDDLEVTAVATCVTCVQW